MIYEYLIGSKQQRGDPKRYPQILGACQFIHDEAEPVLYKSVTFSTRFSTATTNFGRPLVGIEVRAGFKRMVHYCCADEFSLATCPFVLPTCYQSIQHLKVDMGLLNRSDKGDGDPRGLVKANHILYRLVSMLTEARNLKTVSFQLETSRYPRTFDGLNDVLYPLVSLVALRERGVKVALTGLPWDVEFFLHLQSPPSVRCNTPGNLTRHFLMAEEQFLICSNAKEESSRLVELAKALEDAHEQFDTREMVDRQKEHVLAASSNRLALLLEPGEST